MTAPCAPPCLLQEKDELIMIRATDLREEEMQPLPEPVAVEPGAAPAPDPAHVLKLTGTTLFLH